MAARKVTRNKKLTEEANADLERFTRNLAARLDVNVTYSQAIMYAIAATDSTHAWLEETGKPTRVLGISPIENARRLVEGLPQKGGKS